MRILAGLLCVLGLSSVSLAKSNLACTAFVYGEMPFVTIEMLVTDDGHIERLATLIHQGSRRQTAVEENPVTSEQLYNLTVEADDPGHELFLEIYKPKDRDTTEYLDGQLINPASPAYKTMRARCEWRSTQNLRNEFNL
jgi:hypothetical protein